MASSKGFDTHQIIDVSIDLRLCNLCQGNLHAGPDLEEEYAHYSSLKLLKNAASGDYCELCQTVWESIITKQHRFKFEDVFLLKHSLSESIGL